MNCCVKPLVALLFVGCLSQSVVGQSIGEELLLRGDSLKAVNKFQEAFNYYKQSKTVSEQEKNWPVSSVASNRLSSLFFQQSRYDSALKYASLALQLNEKAGKENKETVACLYNIGQAMYFLGRLPESLKHYQRALAIQRSMYGNVHPEIAGTYTFIGVIYSDMGNFSQARDYHERALLLYRQLFGNNHPTMHFPLTNLGLLFRQKGDYDEALKNYEDVKSILFIHGGKNQIYYAANLNNIANVYSDMGDYETAIELCSEACNIAIDLFGPNNPHVSRGYDNLYLFNMQLGKYDEAFEYANKSITARQISFGEKHSLLGRSYRLLGDWYFNMGQFERAVDSYQQSLVALVPEFNSTEPSDNPTFSSAAFNTEILETLKNKGRALSEAYKKTLNKSFLTSAISAVAVCDTIIEQTRKERVKFQDRIELGKTTSLVYESAIAACMLNFKSDHNEKWVAKALYYSQRNKAAVLVNVLADLAAKGQGLIPDHLIVLEQELKDRQMMLNGKLSRRKSQSQSDLADSENELQLVNLRHDSLAQALERSYPMYYKTKFANNALGLTDLQQALSKQQGLIEYFEGKDSVYVFCVTKAKCSVHSFPNDSTYLNLARGFRAFVTDDPALSNTRKQFENLQSKSFQLYSLILGPALQGVDSIVNELIIIPDGLLAFIPFDALQTKINKEAVVGDYGNLPYLITTHDVRYGYAASLLFAPRYKPERRPSQGYISFAPSYAGYVKNQPTMLALGQFRDGITELKWNQLEAKEVVDKMGGDSFLANEASELHFKERAGDYRAIHLAVHAFADESDPMNSRIVFEAENDTLQDGMLYAYELFDMKLNADLVVLSACNTGYGKLERGEGAMSLARAFAYAGVPSTVMSHWQVDDESTSQLMGYFYDNLSKGMTKSEALRQAKLHFLSKAKTPVYQHPFYWAAFATIGNDEPVEGSFPTMPVIGISVALVAVLLFFMLRRRKA